MEKISFFDLLTILVPGALFTLFVGYIFAVFNIQIIEISVNQYYKFTLFFSAALFSGTIINIITRKALFKFYKKIKMHQSILHHYRTSNDLVHIKPFFENMIDDLCEKKDVFENEEEEEAYHFNRIERLWSEIFYELEAKDQIKSPKSYQSFYFFFRNFFTLGLITLIFIALIQFADFDTTQLYIMLAISIIVLVTSYFSAKWNREKMIERMFWTYYSLNKNLKK